MRTKWLTRVVATLALALAPVVLGAQDARPTYDRVTVAGSFGGLSGAAHLDPSSAVDWRLGWSTGVDGTVWLHRFVGLRGFRPLRPGQHSRCDGQRPWQVQQVHL